MDIVGYMAEIIMVSFLLGAVVGGVMAVHLLARPRQIEMDDADMVPVKVKVKR